MKKALLAIILLALAILPAQANEWDYMPIPFYIGATASGSDANSGIVRIPQACQIQAIHITDSVNIGANADGRIVTLWLNGAAYGNVGSATAQTANTPVALTPTAYNLSAGDVLQFKLTKTGVGTTTTDLSATVAVFNATSRR